MCKMYFLFFFWNLIRRYEWMFVERIPLEKPSRSTPSYYVYACMAIGNTKCVTFEEFNLIFLFPLPPDRQSFGYYYPLQFVSSSFIVWFLWRQKVFRSLLLFYQRFCFLCSLYSYKNHLHVLALWYSTSSDTSEIVFYFL